MRACTSTSRARNWLHARRVLKPVLAHTKKRAPKFSILQALILEGSPPGIGFSRQQTLLSFFFTHNIYTVQR